MALLAGKWRTILSYVLIFGLLAAVNLLPPDTSLSEVRAAGVLRACLPSAYPPLVTGDPAAPGIDIELLRGLAKNMDLRLVVSSNAAMGRDFNPRNWHITRAQCDVLAGGVVASPQTRSFLETSPSYAETGWAFVLAEADRGTTPRRTRRPPRRRAGRHFRARPPGAVAIPARAEGRGDDRLRCRRAGAGPARWQNSISA